MTPTNRSTSNSTYLHDMPIEIYFSFLVLRHIKGYM